MEINLIKSALLIMHRGRVTNAKELDLPYLGTVSTVETTTGYKYLWGVTRYYHSVGQG